MYTRELDKKEKTVLNHLVELCCEAYWQAATHCRIYFEQSHLFFSAQIGSGWTLIEKEEMSLADYNEIIDVLQGIFEPIGTGGHSVNSVINRIITVTMDSESGRPIMNLRLDFNGGKGDQSGQMIELTIEDLVEKRANHQNRLDELVFDNPFIN
ncbi:MAG: hypothetical protein AB1489_10755 [Acidobacteriota bacterium]